MCVFLLFIQFYFSSFHWDQLLLLFPIVVHLLGLEWKEGKASSPLARCFIHLQMDNSLVFAALSSLSFAILHNSSLSFFSPPFPSRHFSLLINASFSIQSSSIGQFLVLHVSLNPQQLFCFFDIHPLNFWFPILLLNKSRRPIFCSIGGCSRFD